MPPCLTLSIIKYGSRVSGAIQGKEKNLSLHLSVAASEKKSLWVGLNYSRPTYVCEVHSKSSKLYSERWARDEYFCNGNTLPILIKLEKWIQISTLISVQVRGVQQI